ncbi:right-handed parallel beta-helix repeat-containing protein, partial [Salmonella enterica]|nr:right-handed parallel beta-helix repeat-containing protein [Salmonella enterica]
SVKPVAIQLMANIANAKVIDVDITGTLDGGIRGYGGSNIVIDGVIVHDIGVSALAGECGMGIWFGDYAHYENQTDGLLIQNCRINNIGGVGLMRGDGIVVYNAKNFTLRNNNITTVNRMGISAGSDCLYFKINGNYIVDTLLAGIDIEPDAHYTASNFKIYNNTIIGFASRFLTATAGVGQLFGIDVHANTSYGKVYKNILAAGQYGTEAFHIGNHADEIEITDNDLIGGAVVIPLFIKTFDGSGSKHIKINRNRAKGTCKSFAQIAMSEDVYISENIFSGNSSADSYFLSVATTLGLNVDYNRSSNTTNFIKSGDAGDTSNMKVTNNNAYTLGSGIEIVTSGLLSEVIMTGNSLLCPASSIGIYLEVTMDGAITNLNLRGNIIPLATNKIYVSPSATGWDTLTRNTRSQISVAYNGMQLFELSTNSNIQYLNNGWL